THGVNGQIQDTIVDRAPQDREKLEELTSKSKFTRWLRKTIFKPKRIQTQQTNIQSVNLNEIDKDFEKFQGKIIRNINIETLDPFGYSEKDTTRVPTKTIDKIRNSLNLKTKAFTIKNLLLLKNISLLILYKSKRVNVLSVRKDISAE